MKKNKISPIEGLVNGQVGPLPIDIDAADVTDGTTPPSPSDASCDIAAQMMKNHPGLTAEKADEMIDAFG